MGGDTHARHKESLHAADFLWNVFYSMQPSTREAETGEGDAEERKGGGLWNNGRTYLHGELPGSDATHIRAGCRVPAVVNVGFRIQYVVVSRWTRIACWESGRWP